jgi:hypothetical protein
MKSIHSESSELNELKCMSSDVEKANIYIALLQYRSIAADPMEEELIYCLVQLIKTPPRQLIRETAL